MLFTEIFLLGLALSMDAFAVALCKGLNMQGKSLRPAFTIALFFGFFQGFMPLLGWFLGQQFTNYLASFGHLIAFFLLFFVGGKMIWEAIHSKVETNCCYKIKYKELLLLALATSIDALAVGFSFSFLKVSILQASISIAIITFLISFAGVIIGKRFGLHRKNYAEFFGGFLLILIAFKTLL